MLIVEKWSSKMKNQQNKAVEFSISNLIGRSQGFTLATKELT